VQRVGLVCGGFEDAADVDVFGGRVAVIENGRVVQLASRDDLRSEPATDFVRELFGA